MPLSRGQRRKIKELEEIASLVCVDFWNAEKEPDSVVRSFMLDLSRDRLVRCDIVYSYVTMDEMLTDMTCEYFFGRKKSFQKLWRTKRFQNFNYYVVEELSLLKKLALVKAFKKIPRQTEEVIRLTNTLRNAVAHSFFPVNKRDFKRTKAVTYKGKDVFTLEGFKRFGAEAEAAIEDLVKIAFGKGEPRY